MANEPYHVILSDTARFAFANRVAESKDRRWYRQTRVLRLRCHSVCEQQFAQDDIAWLWNHKIAQITVFGSNDDLRQDHAQR